jgi:hypothetical protein
MLIWVNSGALSLSLLVEEGSKPCFYRKSPMREAPALMLIWVNSGALSLFGQLRSP